jgi:sulfonate transport system substrate-binding protein
VGIVNRYQYFLSAREYAEKKPEILAIAMEELGTIGQWVRQNYQQAAGELAPIQGLEPDVIEAALRHYQHIYRPIDDTVLGDQQRIADTFYQLKLIPKQVSVRDAVLPATR